MKYMYSILQLTTLQSPPDKSKGETKDNFTISLNTKYNIFDPYATHSWTIIPLVNGYAVNQNNPYL